MPLSRLKKPLGVALAPRFGVGDLRRRGLTTSSTTFTTRVSIYVEELGVSTALPGMTVNDEGNMHVMEEDLPDMDDTGQLPPIGVLSRPHGEWPGLIFTIDSFERW